MEVITAKEEFTQRLSDILSPFLFDGFTTLWNKTRKRAEESKTLKTMLIPFQRELEQIGKWNQDIINNEYHRLTYNLDPEILDRLIEAVFVSFVHILSTIRNRQKINKQVRIHVPDTKVFIHRCYVNCARTFYTVPYLFDDRSNVSSQTRKTHFTEAFKLIEDCINKTIRENLPINEILKFDEDDTEDEPEAAEEEPERFNVKPEEPEQQEEQPEEQQEDPEDPEEPEEEFEEEPEPQLPPDPFMQQPEPPSASSEHFSSEQFPVQFPQPHSYPESRVETVPGNSINEDFFTE